MTYPKLLAKFLIAICFAIFAVQPAQAGWQQTFSEEFNGTSLDTTKWNTKYAWGDTIINNELQYYANDAFEFGTRYSGSMSIRADQRKMGGQNYTSGSLTTLGKFGQLYGYFEMRARLPKGQGMWPAFWLLPVEGGSPPEIDIMECVGHKINDIVMSYHTGGTYEHIYGWYTGPDYSAGYHVFGADWKPGEIIFYIDGVERYRIKDSRVTSKAMYMLVNLAVGGNWPGAPDAATPFPSYYDVDYVRAYKRVNNGQPDDLPPTSPNPTPTPNPSPTPGPNDTFNVQSPANGATVSGTVQITGQAGSRWVNVTAYDVNNNFKQVTANVTPANGTYSLTLDTTQLANGTRTLAVDAYVQPAGQTGGEYKRVNLSLNVQNTAGGTLPQPNKYYQLVARHSGKCLDVHVASTANGTGTLQWTCHAGQHQQFKFEDAGNGYYRITPRHSGKALDVAGVSTANGALVQQWEAHGGQNQQWKVESVGNGYYKLTARHSGKVLDVSGVSTADGAAVHQWSYVGGQNQQWLLRVVQ